MLGIILVSLLVSLAIGVFTAIWMVKRTPKWPHLILYAIMILIMGYFFVKEFPGVFTQNFATYLILALISPLMFLWVFLSIPLLALFFGLLFSEGFEERWKFSLSFLSGGIVLLIVQLALLFMQSSLVYRGIRPIDATFFWELAGFFNILAIIVLVTVIVGFFIDIYCRIKKN